MFRFVPNPTFTTEIPIHIAGNETPGLIKIRFKYKDTEQLSEWQKSMGDKSIVDALFEVIDGWEEVEAPDGSAVPFNLDNLKALSIKYYTASNNLTRGYIKELYGAREKN